MTPDVPPRGSAPLALHAASCLAVRARESACRTCTDACPIGVLARRDGAPVLSDGCLGCGRCAAVCPTGALRVPGFAVRAPAPGTPGRGPGPAVTLECWRVAPADGVPDALRVPCLCGLTLGRLLAITAETDGRPLALMDRGFCTLCPTGGGDTQPAKGLVAAAAALLGALGVPPSRHPHLVRQPLPVGRMQADPAGFVLEERVSRRGFLTALTARTVTAVEPLLAAEPGPTRSAAPLYQRTVPEDRQRLLAALRRLAPGVPLPAHLFPSLVAAPTCADHRVCVAACPTGALMGYGAERDDDGERGIVFDPEACVSCGLCVTLCPTRSLSLAPSKGAGAPGTTAPTDPAAPRTLTRHGQRTCNRCGAAYAGAAPSCPACQRDREFAKSAFGALFGGASRS